MMWEFRIYSFSERNSIILRTFACFESIGEGVLYVDKMVRDFLYLCIFIMKKQLEIDDKTGRWSEKEHRVFLEGLKLYGKNWKILSEHIKTRSCTQVRSHAQKYFIKQRSDEEVKQAYRRSILQVTSPSDSKCEVSTQYGEDMLFPLS